MKHHRVICLRLLVGLLVTAVTLTTSVIAQEPEAILYQEDFDNGPAPDWELEPGWQVIQEGDNGLLAGEGHHWAAFNQSFATDFRLQFHLKLVQGRIHLVYHLNDDGRYFIGFDEGGSDNEQQLTWVRTGGPLGGLGYDIRMRPDNPDIMYVTDAWAGVHKSSDGGQTWQAINNGLNNLYVGTLFMNPQNPSVLLAGTGNNQYFQASGVYLSTDGGASWQQTLPDDNINAVEFAPSDPQIAYAGSADAVYRSDDGGLAWQMVSGGDESGWGPPGVRAGFPIDFQVDPRDSNRLFANNYGGGNFVSSDDGRTWAIASQGYTGAQVRDIAVDPAAGGRVFAAARSGLFVSRNGGSAWTGLNTPPAAAMEWYVVALDPMDAQHVLAANNWNGTILESNNGGQAWRQASQPTGEGKSWRAIVFAPADPQTVYAGTSAFYSAGTFDARLPAGGVYVSHDSGAGWQAANASLSQDANITALVVDPQNTLVVYAATGNRGLLKTSDGGQSWTAVTQDLPDSQPLLSIAHHPSAPVLFVGLEQAGLYRSDDGGLTWQPADAGLNPESSISDIIFDPTNAQVLYAADKLSGVYRSDDGGNIWTAVNDGLRNRSVNALAMPVDGRHLYAATEGEGVFRLDLAGSLPPLPDSIAGEETVVPPTPAQAAVQPEGTPVVETGPAAGTQIPAWPIIGGAAVLLLALLGLFWRFRRRS